MFVFIYFNVHIHIFEENLRSAVNSVGYHWHSMVSNNIANEYQWFYATFSNHLEQFEPMDDELASFCNATSNCTLTSGGNLTRPRPDPSESGPILARLSQDRKKSDLSFNSKPFCYLVWVWTSKFEPDSPTDPTIYCICI